jgi:tRNA G10  N-methylase Trm11
LPYLVSRSVINTKLILILAFGDLSHLEACTMFGDELLDARRLSEDVLTVELKTPKKVYENLAGVHKVAVPITSMVDSPLEGSAEIDSFLEGVDDDFSFSVSYYSSQGIEESEYESMVSTMLSIVRGAGFRKANLVRARGGSEVHGRDLLSRKITDFVILRVENRYSIGVTAYVPNATEFRARSNERPVVSSQISISSRLAKVLLNLGGLSRGELMLDPFCGSGTILSEAVLAGVNCIGVDKNPVRIQNAERNLQWITSTSKAPVGSYSMKVGDATKLESVLGGTTSVDAVVTEPILLPRIAYAPRVEKARRMIRNASRLYSESLYSIALAVRTGGRVVIVAPSLRTSETKDVSVNLQDLEEIGLREFHPPKFSLGYPVRIGHENTKWVRRLVYVFEHV